MIRPWTREEIKEFIDLYPITDTEVLMKKYGRSHRAIASKASALLVVKSPEYLKRRGAQAHKNAVGPRQHFRKKWDPEIAQKVLKDYPNNNNHFLARKYDTTVRAISCLAYRHGVVKCEEYRINLARAAAKLGNMTRWT